jgi:hypothetical protein
MMEPLPFGGHNAQIPKAWLVRRVGIVDRESLARYKKSRRRDHQSNNESVLATITPEWWRGAAELLSKMWPDDEIWYLKAIRLVGGIWLGVLGTPLFGTVSRSVTPSPR